MSLNYQTIYPDPPELLPVGETALLIRFAKEISPRINARVHQLDRCLNANLPKGVIETLPAFASLMVIYDPSLLEYQALVEWIHVNLSTLDWQSFTPPRLIELPVNYGGVMGPDLCHVAEEHGLTKQEVVRIHSEGKYIVAMMGFSPGFVYLMGMDARLTTPRLTSPRLHVPPGSVGIAAGQTGVYSIGSPGGWQIIGRTAQSLFDATRAQPFLFAPGDHVRFIAELTPDEQSND